MTIDRAGGTVSPSHGSMVLEAFTFFTNSGLLMLNVHVLIFSIAAMAPALEIVLRGAWLK
jgi:hypothetical protein